MSVFEITVTFKEGTKPFYYNKETGKFLRKPKTKKTYLSYQDLDKYDPVFITRPRTTCNPTSIEVYLKRPKNTAFVGFLIKKRWQSADTAVLTVSTEIEVCLPSHKFNMFYRIEGYEFYFKEEKGPDLNAAFLNHSQSDADSSVSSNDSSTSSFGFANLNDSTQSGASNVSIHLNSVNLAENRDLIITDPSLSYKMDFDNRDSVEAFANIKVNEEEIIKIKALQDEEVSLGICQCIGTLYYLSTSTFIVNK